MSSGQKSWAEEREEEAREAHIKRLEELGCFAIRHNVEALRERLNRMEDYLVSLPREGWYTWDEVKAALAKIS